MKPLKHRTMPSLTEELEFIWDWLENLNPDPERYNFNLYSPGLSHEQIAHLSRRLPFELPDELFQLYGWRNGVDHSNDHPSYSRKYLGDPFLFTNPVPGGSSSLEFYSLQDAIYMYSKLKRNPRFHRGLNSPFLREDLQSGFWNKGLFPIAGFEFVEHLYADISQNPAPVIQVDRDGPFNPDRTYKSLNTLIYTIAECCRMSVYHIVPSVGYGENYVCIKVNKKKITLENEIFEKYNA